jgi:hypothetical protein
LEIKLQIRNQVLAPSIPIHEDWQAENVKSLMQKGLPLSKGMIKKDDSSYYFFSCQDGECSRIVEARRTSDEEVLHKQLALPSSSEKGNMCKESPEKYVHAKGERMKTFPTSKWSMYPCASCGTSNDTKGSWFQDGNNTLFS